MTDNFTPEKNSTPQKMSLEEWKAMKDQERSDLYKLLDQATRDLTETPGCLERYLNTQARMNRYTVTNALLLSAQLPEATQLKTFSEWEKEGEKIKKGAKSISILEPSEYKKSDGSTALVYNVKKVFDVSQTTKEDNAGTFNPPEMKELIAAMLDTCPVSIDLATEIPVQNTAAYFDKNQNTLYVQKEGGDAEYICQCVARELGQVQASLKDNDYERSTSYADAVLTGYLVCRRYGAPTSAMDINRAASKFKGMTPKEIRDELSKVRSYTNDINKRLYDQLYPQRKSHSRDTAR